MLYELGQCGDHGTLSYHVTPVVTMPFCPYSGSVVFALIVSPLSSSSDIDTMYSVCVPTYKPHALTRFSLALFVILSRPYCLNLPARIGQYAILHDISKRSQLKNLIFIRCIVSSVLRGLIPLLILYLVIWRPNLLKQGLEPFSHKIGKLWVELQPKTNTSFEVWPRLYHDALRPADHPPDSLSRVPFLSPARLLSRILPFIPEALNRKLISYLRSMHVGFVNMKARIDYSHSNALGTGTFITKTCLSFP